MKLPRIVLTLVLPCVFLFAVPRLLAQGPPFQTDDPVPVDLHHYEFYVFGMSDGTPVATAPTGPAFEFNWGALPGLQLHAILPWGAWEPSDRQLYAPSGQGPSAFGLADMELGAKWGFIKQTPHRPQIGAFTMLELPTGDSDKGLGVGKLWYKLPLWIEKDWGKWTTDGGAGYTLVHQTGLRSFPYGGFLLKKELSERLELAGELFAHGREGIGAPQTQSSAMIDLGGYYHFKNPDHQLLFAYGHSVAGQTENYAYLGLYWTWGKDAKGGEKKVARGLSFPPAGRMPAM
ncbi:MAG: hypothetical protein WCE75_15205 [Terracidiphilus sp.]